MREFDECKAVLRDWDAGKEIQTVAMGGLGDGYEKAIQTCAMEMLRFMIETKVDIYQWVNEDDEKLKRQKWEEFRKARDAYLYNDNNVCNTLGLSGAQAGAAANISIMYYRHGYKSALDIAGEDRHIKITKDA